MNMFKKVKANSVESYLASIPQERKKDFLFLHKFIQKAAPKLKPHFAYNMLGYGSFMVKNSKKQLIPWPTVSLANQKNYISLFICSVENGKYLVENYKKDLGKVTAGKTCVSFKKVADLNLPSLKKLLQYAAKHPGLEGLGGR
jgi:Domain of unknown function (DU1801)